MQEIIVRASRPADSRARCIRGARSNQGNTVTQQVQRDLGPSLIVAVCLKHRNLHGPQSSGTSRCTRTSKGIVTTFLAVRRLGVKWTVLLLTVPVRARTSDQKHKHKMSLYRTLKTTPPSPTVSNSAPPCLESWRCIPPVPPSHQASCEPELYRSRMPMRHMPGLGGSSGRNVLADSPTSVVSSTHRKLVHAQLTISKGRHAAAGVSAWSKGWGETSHSM